MTALLIITPLGLLIVLSAIGIPYWLTHRHMSSHYDHSDSLAYLKATGKTATDIASPRPRRQR